MRLKFFLFVFLSILLAEPGFAKPPEWFIKMKQIRLLLDTYEDAVRILGKPVDRGREKDNVEYFDFKEGRMWVRFEPGNCGSGMQVGWNVPKWTVVEVSFSPDKHIDPKKIGATFEGFVATPINDDPAIEYVNDELGIDYVVKLGKIQDVTLRPSRKQEHLKCKQQS